MIQRNRFTFEAPKAAGPTLLGSEAPHPTTVFLNLFLGGTGALISSTFQENQQHFGRPVPEQSVHLDTAAQQPSAAHYRVNLAVTSTQVEMFCSNATRFGSTAQKLAAKLIPWLGDGELGQGSRTYRAITQFAYLLHREERIVPALRQVLTRLITVGPPVQVRPILTTSSGGGCGGALAILLADLFSDREYRSQLLMGASDDVLLPPIIVMIEPFFRARASKPCKRDRIFANAYATRIELDQLLRRKQLDWAYVESYTNGQGVILSDDHLVGKVAGSSLFDLEANWGFFQERAADHPMAIRSRYLGLDTLEQSARRRRENRSAMGTTPSTTNGEGHSNQ